MKFSHLQVGQRLAMTFGSMLLCISLIGAVGYGYLASLHNSNQHIVKLNVPAVLISQDILSDSHEIARALRDIVISNDSTQINKEVSFVVAKQKEIDEFVEKIKKTAQDTPNQALIDNLQRDKLQYDLIVSQVLRSQSEGKKDEAIGIVLGQLREVQNTYTKSVSQFIEKNTHDMQISTALAEANFSSARNWLLSLSVLAIALGCVLSWRVTRSIARPLAVAVRVAQTVSSGDLRTRMRVSRTDETGQVLQSLMAMNTSLQHIVGQVRNSTDNIALASKEIASDNVDLSTRTEQQANALHESVRTIEELASNIKLNSEHAQLAKQLADSASMVAKKSGMVVEQVVTTMGAIRESSHKIVDIISVIDGIAFQTNILALNAAVEAAAAGEQGRGFAVVASEVRSLAQRSANAAKEIKSLIVDSVEKVGSGGLLVNQAGTTMQEVVASVQRVTEIMGEISQASKAQQQGIEQINLAISQMDQGTQQNATLVEQAAAAASALQSQAENLAMVVSIFKLADETPIHVDTTVDEQIEQHWAQRHAKFNHPINHNEQALCIAVSAIGHAKRNAFQQKGETY